MEIATNVFRFDTGPFNWYVVREGRELTLVDAGFPGHYQVLIKGLASIGQSVADVKCILLTHAHADHMGFAERVRRESNCPVFIQKTELLRGEAFNFRGSVCSQMRGDRLLHPS